ncbi:MAG: hypothetical protein ABIQ99_04775 [Thermoflexales bacterium]
MSAKNTIRTIGGVAGALAGIGAAATAYGLAVRPRMLRWGANPEEVERVYTGDEFVLNPQIKATHAITVHAAVEKVFPWLVQMGQGRAGFYSVEAIENRLFELDIHNADRILPEYQELKVGDRVVLGRGVFARVAVLAPLKHLILRATAHGDENEEGAPPLKSGETLNMTWGFFTEAQENGDTRLIERFRVEFTPTLANNVMFYGFIEPGAFFMERSMLLGIKARAEGVFGKTLVEAPVFNDRLPKALRDKFETVWQHASNLVPAGTPIAPVAESDVVVP